MESRRSGSSLTRIISRAAQSVSTWPERVEVVGARALAGEVALGTLARDKSAGRAVVLYGGDNKQPHNSSAL